MFHVKHADGNSEEQTEHAMQPLSSLSNGSTAECLAAMQGGRVAILGDVMLDHYQIGSVDRISPEAPVPVVRIDSEEYKLGGAANVARNVKALGGEPFLLSCCGKDGAHDKLQELLELEGIGSDLVVCPGRQTTQKTRVIAQNQQVVRIDREELVLDAAAKEQLREKLGRLRQSYGVLLLSDYGKGTVSRELLDSVHTDWKSAARVIVDPKQGNFPLYQGSYLITPNAKEARERTGRTMHSKAEIIRAGDWIRERNTARNVLITLGPEGMVLFCEDGTIWKIPAAARKVYDVTGAGDTVVGTIGLAASAGCSLLQGSLLANAAAGLVVAQLGTAVVSNAELQSHLADHGEQLQIEQWR
jgi:rfaE bifunctional protein kinase chain/domain